MQVVVAGGSGFIGRHLCQVLARRGDKVVMLTRGGAAGKRPAGSDISVVQWDPARPDGLDAVMAGADAVVNLCGASVAEGRWTQRRKKELEESRLVPTRALAEAMAKAAKRPKVFISASAVGVYGDRGDQELTEADGPGKGFLADLGQKWEAAAQPAAEAGVRLVALRLGVVLDAGGGAMAQMLPPFNYFVGGPLGSGKQWFPWIHLQDVSGLVVYILGNEGLRGPVNATAPIPVTNEEFSIELARRMGRPCLFRVPAGVLSLAVGEMAHELLLASTRALPKAALDRGYFFRYCAIGEALKDIVGTYYSAAPNRWWTNQGKTVADGRRIDEQQP
ncbi:MAG: TIGR01777 family protein [Candidatus Wallbacteria bacterium]|nr:TIGR01777 family protein [Candidatus Wallbacteria bacterium]